MPISKNPNKEIVARVSPILDEIQSQSLDPISDSVLRYFSAQEKKKEFNYFFKSLRFDLKLQLLEKLYGEVFEGDTLARDASIIIIRKEIAEQLNKNKGNGKLQDIFNSDVVNQPKEAIPYLMRHRNDLGKFFRQLTKFNPSQADSVLFSIAQWLILQIPSGDQQVEDLD